MNRTVTFVAVFVAVTNLACKCCGSEEKLESIAPKLSVGGSSGGASSIEGLGNKLIDEANEGDVDAVMKLFPTAEQAAEALDCPGANPIDEARQEARGDLVEELTEMADEGVKMEMLGVLDEGDREIYAVGDDVQGCTAKMPLVVAEIEYKLKITAGDHVEDEDAGFVLIQLGDGGNWYLIEQD